MNSIEHKYIITRLTLMFLINRDKRQQFIDDGDSSCIRVSNKINDNTF